LPTDPLLQAASVDVRLEDQQKINTFSRLVTKLHELEAQIAAKKVGGSLIFDQAESRSSSSLHQSQPALIIA
jgi:hypothetical protein